MHHWRIDVHDGWLGAFGSAKSSSSQFNSCPDPLHVGLAARLRKATEGEEEERDGIRDIPPDAAADRNEETNKRHGVLTFFFPSFFFSFLDERNGDGSLDVSGDWINKVLKSRTMSLASHSVS